MTTHRVFPEDPAVFSYATPSTILYSGAGRLIQFFYDSACTSIAHIKLASNDTSITNAILTVGADSMLPDFYEATDSVEELWGRVLNGTGPAYRITPRLALRVDALEVLTGVLEGEIAEKADLVDGVIPLNELPALDGGSA